MLAFPIACTLSPAELYAQRDSLLTGLAEHAVERSTLEHGMRLKFDPTAERMRQIDTVIRRESECCPFLNFRVGLPLAGRGLTLDVTGPEGTEEMLALLLDASVAVSAA